MRRISVLRRIASVLIGIWFVLFAAEVPVLHVCAVHNVRGSMAHMAHSPVHHDAPHSNHATCTCPGDCCPGVGARLATPVDITPARIVGVVEPAPVAPTVLGFAAARVVLPPSLGPPAISG